MAVTTFLILIFESQIIFGWVEKRKKYGENFS